MILTMILADRKQTTRSKDLVFIYFDIFFFGFTAHVCASCFHASI